MKKLLLAIVALLFLFACTDTRQQQTDGTDRADNTEQTEVPAAVPLDSLPEGTCRSCRGTGRTPCFWCQGNGRFSCGACGGKGYKHYSMVGHLHRQTCDMCRGSGKLHCTICDGSGHGMCVSCVGTGKNDLKSATL